MVPRPNPRTVFLDWYGTLCCSLFLGRWGVDPTYAERHRQFERVWGEAGPLIVGWMRGRYCAEQVAEIFALAVGVPTSELLAELQAGCECMEIDPALLAAIGQLRASGTKVVLATDNMDSFTRWTVPALGLERHFDGILNSFDLGGLKEDRDAAGHSPFFSLCLDSGIYRPPYLLIDDSPGVLNVRDLGVDVITVSSPADTLVVLHRLCDQATAANRPLPAAALTI